MASALPGSRPRAAGISTSSSARSAGGSARGAAGLAGAQEHDAARLLQRLRSRDLAELVARTARSWPTSATRRPYTAPARSGGARWRPDAEPQLVREEETTWRARPDWSRDGKRIVYASYAGRNWHQLWATTAAPARLSAGADLRRVRRHRPALVGGRTRASPTSATAPATSQIHVLELPGRPRPDARHHASATT